jgi:hypothetical protein
MERVDLLVDCRRTIRSGPCYLLSGSRRSFPKPPRDATARAGELVCSAQGANRTGLAGEETPVDYRADSDTAKLSAG